MFYNTTEIIYLLEIILIHEIFANDDASGWNSIGLEINRTILIYFRVGLPGFSLLSAMLMIHLNWLSIIIFLFLKHCDLSCYKIS